MFRGTANALLLLFDQRYFCRTELRSHFIRHFEKGISKAEKGVINNDASQSIQMPEKWFSGIVYDAADGIARHRAKWF
jgi:hypothetical protein